jgi:hypothetical protein
MQRLQRKAGKLLHRTADDAEVGTLLADFEDGDRALKIVCRETLVFNQYANTPLTDCGIRQSI